MHHPSTNTEVKIRFCPDRKGASKRLRGLAKTDMPPPTDAEVAAMLEERFVEKYLKLKVLVYNTNIILDSLLERKPFVEDADA
jgi:hypothetical protein